MRISDWSSDVCSSDLLHFSVCGVRRQHDAAAGDVEDLDVLVLVEERRDVEAHPAVEKLGLQARFERIEDLGVVAGRVGVDHVEAAALDAARSEEHTSELQSLMRISYAVFCLKKKIKSN